MRTHIPANQRPARDPEAGFMVRVRIVRIVNNQDLRIFPDEDFQDLVGGRIRVPQKGVSVAKKFRGAPESPGSLPGLRPPDVPLESRLL